MPEILEVESARAVIEAHALDRVVSTVYAPDAWFLKRGLTPMALTAALPGHRFVAARRRGKLLVLDTDDGGPALGMHLGMSGRILVDDPKLSVRRRNIPAGSETGPERPGAEGAESGWIEAGDPLIYASNRDVLEWRRFGVSFADGGAMWLRDPRRLGAVELDPDEERLGPDAFTLTRAQLDERLARSGAPVKALLMNQAKIAGLGNLLVDEVLWRAGVAPTRVARSLDRDERAQLHRAIRTTLRVLGRRGGSHTGDLTSRRLPGAVCPRDGTPLVRSTVAGRTTFSCPLHQR